MSNCESVVRAFATTELGFDDCRFAKPHLTYELDDYRNWIAEQKFGDMEYLARHLPFKESPELVLPGIQSAIVVIANYKNTSEKQQEGPFKIARYAVGEDYHITIANKLSQLIAFIEKRFPGTQHFYGVDSRPIPERSLALKAGIGFRGKNSMVIKPTLGSYFLIGVVYTTLNLPEDPPQPGGCGSCTRCIDACPTHAISPEGQFNAEACISYQTIERKTPLTESELAQTKGWIFGCDICQEVCPFNHANTPITTWPEFMPAAGIGFSGIRDAVSSQQSVKFEKSSPLFRSRKRLASNIDTQIRML